MVGGKGKEGGFILYSWVVGRGIVSWQKDRGKKNKKTPSIPPNGRERQQETLKGKEAEKPPGATVCLLLLDPPTVDADVWKQR